MTRTIDLNDSWRLIDGNDGTSYHTSGVPAAGAIAAQLPCFTHMYIDHHVGISWYERSFTLDALPSADESALLTFEAAVFRTEVSVNGTVVGEHIGVEDPFAFDVTAFLRVGENRITVRTSKPHLDDVDGCSFREIPHRNQTATMLMPGWCYNESGLCGEAALKILPRVRIDDLYLSPDCDSGEIRAEITVENARTDTTLAVLTMDVHRAPDGEIEDTVRLPMTLAPGTTKYQAVLAIHAPRLWSVADPNLYTVRASVTAGELSHSVTKKCGFRSFIVGEDGYFYLNGRRIYLKCSHTGNCFPESAHNIARDRELLRRDFLMAKAAGFNCIRFISGAALPLQLDLCDEIGLMIYEEPVASWCGKNGPHTAELYLHDLLTMVKRDRSHPSVTIWGLINETRSTEPDNILVETARDALPALRALDDTRLVLFSSGRWDKWEKIGSVCNPGCSEWQCLWGYEGDAISERGDLGDIHYYPSPIPLRAGAIDRMQRFGEGTPRPVFISETGVGSALDTIQLTRRFRQDGAIPFCPDVWKIGEMNDRFHAELRKFGFDKAFPMPSELMRASMRNHAYYRTQAFDLLRGNGNLCGISLTGLLDHSICGEGLWTLHRRFKPMIADVLQDGFSDLRMNVLLDLPVKNRGAALGVTISIASADVLTVGGEYTVAAGIFDADGAAHDVHTFRVTVTEEAARRMVIPVACESWDTAALTPGLYEFKAELLEADAAAVREFHVVEPAHTDARIFAAGMRDAETAKLAALGFDVQPLDAYDGSGTIAAGHVDAALAEKLRGLIEVGARVVTLCTWEAEDASLSILPEERRPVVRREGDWLYHRENILMPGGRFFEGIRTGLADALLFTDVAVGVSFEADGAAVPDVTDAMCFETGLNRPEGFIGGWRIASFAIGAGELVMNSFDLLGSASPTAERLLVNMLA